MSKNKQIVGGSGDPREGALNALFADSPTTQLLLQIYHPKVSFIQDFKGLMLSP